MIELGYTALANATLCAHLALAALVLTAAAHKRVPLAAKLREAARENAYTLIFLATLSALLGSLFFSEIARFTPCVLCWWQRIFMYPQVLLVYIGIMRNDALSLRWYLLGLNAVGAFFSLYHNVVLLYPQYGEVVSCAAKGGPSCIDGYQFYYGYITIPLMALTVFVWNIVLLLFFHPSKKTAS